MFLKSPNWESWKIFLKTYKGTKININKILDHSIDSYPINVNKYAALHITSISLGQSTWKGFSNSCCIRLIWTVYKKKYMANCLPQLKTAARNADLFILIHWLLTMNNFLNTTHLKCARASLVCTWGQAMRLPSFKLQYTHSSNFSYSSTLTIWVCFFLFSDC